MRNSGLFTPMRGAGLVALAIFLIVINLVRFNSENANAPTPAPTPNFMATMAAQQQTADAMQAQALGITLEPSTDALSALLQLRMAAVTPQPEKLRTYCENAYQGTRTPDECQTWVDQVIKDHPDDVVYCQNNSEFGLVGNCLQARGVPLP